MRPVSYYCSRGTGRNHRASRVTALVTGETTAKKMKVIILDAPCVVMWVPLDHEKHMRPLKTGQRVVLDYNDDGVEIGRHLEGGRAYSLEKAKKHFRAQWRAFNEGRMPRELSPGCS